MVLAGLNDVLSEDLYFFATTEQIAHGVIEIMVGQ